MMVALYVPERRFADFADERRLISSDRRAWRNLWQLRLRARLVGAVEEAGDVVAKGVTMRELGFVANRYVAQFGEEAAQTFAGLRAYLRIGVAVGGEIHQTRGR